MRTQFTGRMPVPLPRLRPVKDRVQMHPGFVAPHNFDCLQLKKLITIRRVKSSINTTSFGHSVWLKPRIASAVAA